MFKKNFLSLSLMFLSVLSLGLFCTSYTMAYTPDDFHDFLGYLVQHNITSNNSYNLSTARDIYNNWNTYIGYIQGAGYDLADYNNFTIGISGSNNGPCILAYNGTINYSCSNQNVNFTSTTFTQFYFRYSQANVSTPSLTSRDGYAFMFDGSPTNNTFANCISINKWSYVNILPVSDLKTSNLPWYIADVRIAEATPNAQIYLYNNGESVGELQTISHSVAGGTLYQVEIINTNGLINNTSYSVKVYDGTSLLTSSEDFTLQWTNDSTPSQPSGDTSGDSGGNCDCVPYLIEILGVISGDVISAIDNNGNVIVGTLSQLQEQLQANNQILDDIKSGLFGSGDSGDGILGGTTLESGDEPTLEDLPSVTIPNEDDPSHEFFSWLMLNIIDILEDENEQTLIIPIYKTNYVIRSDVFKLEIEPLRTFIQAGWWFIVGVPFLKYVRRCIEKVKGGEIPASDDKSDLLGNVL